MTNYTIFGDIIEGFKNELHNSIYKEMEKLNFNDWKKAYKSGAFDIDDVDMQSVAGWVDWFCDSSELPGKTTKLAPMVLQLMSSPKFNNETSSALFYNNQDGTDEIDIHDTATDDFWTLTERKDGVYLVTHLNPDTDCHVVVDGRWWQVLKYFEV